MKKRRSKYLSQVEVSGVAAIFFFLVCMFLRLYGVPHEYRAVSVDLYESKHAIPQSGALKEDAINIAVSRDGTVYFCNTKILGEDIPERILEKLRAGADPKIYIRADARGKYADVAAVIRRIRQARLDQVVLITEQRDRGLRS